MTTLFVTGSRTFEAVSVIDGFLADHVQLRPGDRLVVGDARGADTFAADWARAHDIAVSVFEADWSTFGRGAGLRRNAEMVASLPQGAVCVCFAAGRLPCAQRPNRIRDLLSPGSRNAVGLCLNRGLRCSVVFECGSIIRVAPKSPPRPDGWYPRSRSDAGDINPDDILSDREVGWDAPPSKPLPEAWRPPSPPVSVWDDDYEDRQAHDRLCAAHGDNERRSRLLGETQATFVQGDLSVCEVCGETIVVGDRRCPTCNERIPV
jgi:hypothetical protein